MNISCLYKGNVFAISVAIALLVPIFKVSAQTTSVVVTNPSSNDIVDYTVQVPIGKLCLSAGNYIAVSNQNEQVPIEFSVDVCGNTSAVFPITNLDKGVKKTYTIQKGELNQYPKRTYAELSHKIGGEFVQHGAEKKNRMEYVGGYSWVKPNYIRVPDGFTDHSYYIKYEGPGWESDKSAFRFYLDWRNAIDVFGKRTAGIVLPQVGIDGYENYHKLADWGMDNMKVGKTLGLGTIAIWDGQKAVRVEKSDSVVCYIPTDGKIRSQVMTTYYGWNANGEKCDLKAMISIDAGSRASYMDILLDKPVDNITTGIYKDEKGEFFKSDNKAEWGYIATFGQQSLNNDMMGLAVFYRTKDLKEVTEDKLNHLVILKPDSGRVQYYFMPTWELDWEPVVTKADFQKCIDEVLNRLNGNVKVAIQ